MAGVARESVSRTVSDWKRQDVIRKPLPNHYVIHKEMLEREATDRLR
jgi:hypothetical protein